jgi:O-antigen ligase/tetratricopeptide (TPR) repeat protein
VKGPKRTRESAFSTLTRAVLVANLVLCPLVFSRHTVEAFEFVKVSLVTLVALVLVAIAATGAAARIVERGADWRIALRQRAHEMLLDPIAVAVIAYVISAGASTVASISPRTSLFGAHENFAGLVTVLAYAVIFFATRRALESARQVERLLLLSIVPASVTATYALLQIARVDPVQWTRTSEAGSLVRPLATLGHPNLLAAYLVMVAPLLAHGTLRAVRERRWPSGGIFAVVGLLSLIAIAASVSRGAWLALACTLLSLLVGWFVIGNRRPAVTTLAVCVTAVIAAVAVAVMLPDGFARVSSMAERVYRLFDSASRLHIWRASLGIFADHPWLGSGLDTFQLAFASQRTPEYWLEEWNASPARAHNEALHILATQGLVGVAAAAAMVVGLGIGLTRILRGGDAASRALAVAAAGGAIGFGVQAMFSFSVAACAVLFVTFAAALSALSRSHARPLAETASPRDLHVAMGAGMIALLVFVDNGGGIPGVHPLVVVVMLGALLAPLMALSRLEARSPQPRGRRRVRRTPDVPPGDWRARALAAVPIALVVAAAFMFVIQPFRAQVFAREGLLLRATASARATEWLEKAAATAPHTEILWVWLGTAQHERALRERGTTASNEALARARSAYAEAAQLVPVNHYNTANLGRVLGDLARRGLAPAADAFAAFDRALAADPNNVYFYTDAASAALTLGDRERAASYAARLTERYPGFGPGPALQGHVALLNNQFETAARFLEVARGGDWRGRESWRGVAASNLAAAYLALNRPSEAAAAAREATRLLPNDPGARANLARAMEMLGQ